VIKISPSPLRELTAMAKQQKNGAHVPKFGNWDNEGNVPYTLYFDNARKGKGVGVGGKPMNPNDPVENPEAFSSSYAAPSPRRSGPEHGRAPPNIPPASPPPAHRHERRPSDAPANPPPMSPSPYGGASPYRAEPPRRAAGRAAGGYSVEQSPSPSPLHPYSQSRAADYSAEGNAYGLVPNSVDRPNRPRGASRGNETPTRGSAVPKFGDWDSNPASADGYTHIFNKVREEKSTQAKAPAGFGKDAGARGNGPRQHDDGYVSSSRWCFGWCK
jgi:RPM1-interacting protein 4